MSEDRLIHLPTRGLDLCYRLDGSGDGPVVVLIMGLGMQLVAWPQALVDGLLAQGCREIQPAFPRHHHVEDDQVEAERGQLCPAVGGVRGGGDDKAVVDQIAAQKLSQASVVVDDQDMRLILIHRYGL